MRGVATRAVTSAGAKSAINSTGGRLASSVAGHYGVNAIQRGQQNRPAHRPDQGFSQWAKQNPGGAVIGVIGTAMKTGTMGDNAMANTNSILQSTQFR